MTLEVNYLTDSVDINSTLRRMNAKNICIKKKRDYNIMNTNNSPKNVLPYKTLKYK